MNSLEAAIGRRLRTVREQKGFSKRELAERSGLSHTAIAKIENGTLSTTVASLQKLAQALQLTLTDLLPREQSQHPSPVVRLADLTRISFNGHTIEQIGSDLAGRKLQMMRDIYAPGASTGDDMLCHPGEEAGFVLEGCLEIILGDQTFKLDTGDTYAFDSTIPHAFRNPGKETCVVIAANTPPSL